MRPYAVICALNEAPTIGGVVAAAHMSGALSGVLVVDDGSTDGTADVARAHGAHVLRFDRNQGKGQALRAGLASVSGDPVAMFDADLIGFRPDHVAALVDASERGYDMVCGLREHGLIGNVVSLVLPLITGERVLRRRVLAAIPPSCWSGYAIETAMNDAVKRIGGHVACVPMDGVTIRNKTKKVGVLDGTIRNIKMMWHIGSTSRSLRRSCGTTCER